jgi:hypothetical protein
MAHNQSFASIDPVWKDETAYLIGGGPSLKEFNWELLRGKRIIAINRAFQVLPWADVLYWTDAQFYKWYRREIDEFKGMKVSCRPLEVPAKDIKILQGVRNQGLDMRPEYICDGNNSGYGALNLAVKLGAKRIYLLGYDMHSSLKATHWHDGYFRRHNHTIYNRLFTYFGSALPVLKEMNIEVWNANPASHLECFKKCTLTDAINNTPVEIKKEAAA